MLRKIIKLFNRLFVKTLNVIIQWAANLRFMFQLYIEQITIGKHWKITGFAYIKVNKNASIIIGDYFKLNNRKQANPIGRVAKSTFYMGENAKLVIGNNVGISFITIACFNNVFIGNNVRIGGDVIIYDTDFHSLNANERTAIPEIKQNIKTKPVHISNNVFIGAHSILLKGCSVGENSIVGAGSVVTGDIPDNQIWGGNPAIFIKKIKY